MERQNTKDQNKMTLVESIENFSDKMYGMAKPIVYLSYALMVPGIVIGLMLHEKPIYFFGVAVWEICFWVAFFGMLIIFLYYIIRDIPVIILAPYYLVILPFVIYKLIKDRARAKELEHQLTEALANMEKNIGKDKNV